MLDVLSLVADWIVGPGFDAVGNFFASAWDTLQQAVDAVRPAVDAVYAGMAAAVAWVLDVAVPAIGTAFVDAWAMLLPVLQAVGDFVISMYTSVLVPVISWIVDTGLPAIATTASAWWNSLQPVFAGLWTALTGVWDLGKALAAWTAQTATVLIQGITGVTRDMFGILAWGWTNVLQPIVGWVWTGLKPMLDDVGNILGWLLDKVGKLLSWLAQLITLSGDATAAANGVPVPAGAPTLQPPRAPAPAASGPAAFTPPPPHVFDFRRDAGQAADAAKQMGQDFAKKLADGVTSGAASVKGLGLPNFTAPMLKMPHVQLPSLAGLGRIGEGSGVEPLADRFADLRRGTAAVAESHAAGKSGEHPDVRQQRRDMERTKNEYNDRIRDAQHGGASYSEVEAIRREKQSKLRGLQDGIDSTSTADRTAGKSTGGVTINANPPALDQNKLATAVAGEVLKGNNRMLDQAIFVKIADNQLKPAFSCEAWDNGTGRKIFGCYGFAAGDVSVGALTESVSRARLIGYRPDVAVHCCSEIREVRFNGITAADGNYNACKDVAEKYAQAAIQQLDHCRLLQVKGFFVTEVSGRVNEIRYNVADVRTDISIDGWTVAAPAGHRPNNKAKVSADPHAQTLDQPAKPAARTFSSSAGRSAEKRSASGNTGARPSSTKSDTVAPEQTGVRNVFVVPTDAVSGQANRYIGTSRSGKFNAAATGGFAVGNLGVAGTLDDCKIWANGKLELDMVYSGIAGPVDSSGKLIVFVNAGGGGLAAPLQKYQHYQPIDDTLTPIWTTQRIGP